MRSSDRIFSESYFNSATPEFYLVYKAFYNATKTLFVDKMLEAINSLFGRHPERIKAKVEIYTWQTCPYCIRAKLLLWWKGVKFIEYKIDGDEVARNAMAVRANGKRTVPQIFINNKHLGGCDELYALDGKGQLEPALQSIE